LEIRLEQQDNLVEMHVSGVLDNNWSEHLAQAIDEAVRGNSHRLLVNLSGVTYLSSAGISVLLKAHAQLQRIHGFFGVCDPSPQVRQVLRLTGLEKRLICDGDAARRSTGTMLVTSQPEYRCVAHGDAEFEIYEIPAEEPLRCRVFGNPANLPLRSFDTAGSRRVPFGRSAFGLGLGAFGSGFDECRERFGEFLAVAGAAVQLPAQTGSAPDYQLAREEFVPVVEVLYGLQCVGDFRQLARFESAPGASIGLSALAEQCLDFCESGLVGLAIVAESAGLAGAALRRSPAAIVPAAVGGDEQTAGDLFSHPGVRDWISFSPERVHSRSLALVVGVAARNPIAARHSGLSPLLKPLDPAGKLVGHFHAAPFPYSPLKKRRLVLSQTIDALFEAKEPAGVLHLLGDYRPISGAGESLLISGAAWVGPIADVISEGA